MSFSLLFPEGTENENISSVSPDSQLYEELELDFFAAPSLSSYYSCDPSVLRYRLDLFRDIRDNDSLIPVFQEFAVRLREYAEFRSSGHGESTETLLSQMIDARFYIKMLEDLSKGFSKVRRHLKSAALTAFADRVAADTGTPEYAALRKNMEQLSRDFMQVTSITVGINLNSQLQPAEAGLVSINKQPFRSGHFLDRLFRLELKKDEYTCLAPITSLEGKLSRQQYILQNNAVCDAMDTVLHEALRRCRAEMSSFFHASMLWYASLRQEVTFVLGGAKYMLSMAEKKIPLCEPIVSENGKFRIEHLYPLQLTRDKTADEIVSNIITFDEESKIYILTGPNSGGKTVFVRGVATAQLLFQAGLPIPAVSAVMPIMDHVYTQFPKTGTGQPKAGRLEEECIRLSSMLEQLTPRSLVLLDETFSSTNAKDGTLLAESTLAKLRDIGCCAIFSTHLHELTESIGKLNENIGPGKSPIGLLAAEIVGGRRTYKMRRGRAETSSDARSIAEKYGLL